MSGSDSHRGRNNKEIIEELNRIRDDLKKDLPNGELRLLMNDVKSMIRQQQRMSENISEIKRKIMHPEEGIIVRLNKNTEYRKMLENQATDNASILEEHQDLVKFKQNVTKLLWLIVGTIISIIASIFFVGR